MRYRCGTCEAIQWRGLFPEPKFRPWWRALMEPMSGRTCRLVHRSTSCAPWLAGQVHSRNRPSAQKSNNTCDEEPTNDFTSP